jgi:imidazolonepropionase-like amidohydrolase
VTFRTRRLAIALTLAAATSLSAPAFAKDVVIHAGRLIDGVSRQPRERMSILIKGDRIVGVEQGFVDKPGAEVVDLSTSTVLPGLIDAHVHLLIELGKGSQIVNAVTKNAFDHLLEGTVNARKTLMAGFTSVRDVGGYTPAIVALKKAVTAGEIAGPRMWVAGSIISPTGGHADASTGFDDALSKPEWTDGIADGPEEAIKSVRRHHREGTDLIKIVPSGGVASVGDDPQAQLMTDEEIKAVVDTAHTLHMKVAAHAHGTVAIEHAAKLGVDSIEHGSFADADGDKIMKANGTWLVPTLTAGASVVDYAKLHPELLAPSVAAKALAVGPIMQANLSRAYKAGVKIAFGTDAGVFAHGTNAREFELMVGAGMTPMDTIIAATSSAATLIGDEADIGSIQAGRYADIIAVAGDPLKDIAQLRSIAFVMKGGAVVKAGPATAGTR